MSFAHFFAPLLLAAGAAAHFQIDLYPNSPRALEALSDAMNMVAYESHPFIGNIPWYPYSMAVDVGTPAQRQSMAISLSHGDSWVLYSDLCLPNTNPNFTEYVRNCSSGSFGDEESTTLSFNESDSFFERYFDRYVEGLMIKDTVRLGGTELASVDLGVALKTTLDTGFLGLGTPWLTPPLYANRTTVLDEMVEQGLIRSPAFSMHAEEKNDTTGSLLFSAVDKSKFDGTLQRIQASAARDKFSRTDYGLVGLSTSYIVNVSAVWRADAPGDKPREYVNTEAGGAFYAAIDPTFALSNLPDYVATPIYEQIRPSIGHNIGMWTVECDRADLDMTVAIELGGEGGYRLNVTLQDLVLPAASWHLLEPNGTKNCLLGIQSTRAGGVFSYDGNRNAPDWVIGGMLLKKTYAVFDSVNMEISLAPLKSDLGGKGDIVAFDSPGAHAPESSFVGFEECFSSCPVEQGYDENAAPPVDVHRGLIVAWTLSVLGFIMLG